MSPVYAVRFVPCVRNHKYNKNLYLQGPVVQLGARASVRMRRKGKERRGGGGERERKRAREGERKNVVNTLVIAIHESILFRNSNSSNK